MKVPSEALLYSFFGIFYREIRLFVIEFYKKKNGKVPIESFIDSLDTKMRNKAIMGIELLKTFGNNLRLPYSKSIGDGLFELRIKFGSDITRIFYFFYVENKIVITNGFAKKTNKTPIEEIKKAKNISLIM